MGVDLGLRLGCLMRDVAVELYEMDLGVSIGHHLIGIDFRNSVDVNIHIRLTAAQPHVAHIYVFEHDVVDRHHVRPSMFLGRNSDHPIAFIVGNSLILLLEERNGHRFASIGGSPDTRSVVALDYHSARNDLRQFYLSLDRISRYSQHSC